MVIRNLKYIITGFIFGLTLVKGEIISWYRIYEMFHFGNIHMYGVIGSAVITGAISVFIIRKFKIKTFQGEEIIIPKKPFNKGVIIGGLIFGIGWALTGACPGPIFAQIGAGYTVSIITLISALAGTYVYGRFKSYLPH